jgi:hypothetical protein
MRRSKKVREFVEKYFCLTTIAAVVAIVLSSCSIDTNGYYSKGSSGATKCVKKSEFFEECSSRK